ncbi:MAG TPA: MFS transporter [Rhizomicrobium sp.]|nr:MFS transporter [Rhizomicrobium sp.]
MAAFDAMKGWTSTAKHTVTASYLAWTLDAYDFFLLTLVFKDIATQFGTSITKVAVATMLTLACRPIGAFIFGRLADHYGRRPVLMLDIALYSILSFLIAFTPNIEIFYVACAAFGVAMGGVWGICASLSMETIKPSARGFVSGLLQSGYPSGFLISAVIFGYLYPIIGWRGMFMVGVIPAAILILYIFVFVPESQHFNREQAKSGQASTVSILRNHGKVALFAIFLMMGFNFFSHGTQDVYTTFLRVQHGFDPPTVKNVLVIANIGAIIGGLFFGSFSQGFGRRRTIILVTLLALPVIYFWSHGTTPVALALGAFLMQVCVQGAWGVVPAHLNELAPAAARGTFAGTCYQLGNLIAAVNNPLQSAIAEQTGGNYSLALAVVATGAALLIATLAWLGPEAHNVEMGRTAPVSE